MRCCVDVDVEAGPAPRALALARGRYLGIVGARPGGLPYGRGGVMFCVLCSVWLWLWVVVEKNLLKNLSYMYGLRQRARALVHLPTPYYPTLTTINPFPSSLFDGGPHPP